MTSYAIPWKAADMTLRDYFAAQALNGMCAAEYAEAYPASYYALLATAAYDRADAMIAVKSASRQTAPERADGG